MGAAERTCDIKVRNRFGFAPRDDAPPRDENVRNRRFRARDRHDAPRSGACFQSRVDVPANVIVDADQRDFGARNKPLFDARIARQIAMSIKMIGRDVNEQADAWRKRGREIDLIGRTLDHVGSRVRRRR